jgi:hypothetical protein
MTAAPLCTSLENPLRERGLPRIDVGDDAEVSDMFQFDGAHGGRLLNRKRGTWVFLNEFAGRCNLYVGGWFGGVPRLRAVQAIFLSREHLSKGIFFQTGLDRGGRVSKV